MVRRAANTSKLRKTNSPLPLKRFQSGFASIVGPTPKLDSLSTPKSITKLFNHFWLTSGGMDGASIGADAVGLPSIEFIVLKNETVNGTRIFPMRRHVVLQLAALGWGGVQVHVNLKRCIPYIRFETHSALVKPFDLM